MRVEASLSIDDVVILVNEFADAARLAAGESDHPYPSSASIGMRGVSETELVNLANGLHPAFGCGSTTNSSLNELADELNLRHRLGPDGQLTWVSTTRDSKDPLVMALASLIDFVDRHGAEVLGVCSASKCVDVYADTSQAKNRAYCSLRCSNRARALRWRSRRTQG